MLELFRKILFKEFRPFLIDHFLKIDRIIVILSIIHSRVFYYAHVST
jgi:hypothetical protein